MNRPTFVSPLISPDPVLIARWAFPSTSSSACRRPWPPIRPGLIRPDLHGSSHLPGVVAGPWGCFILGNQIVNQPASGAFASWGPMREFCERPVDRRFYTDVPTNSRILRSTPYLVLIIVPPFCFSFLFFSICPLTSSLGCSLSAFKSNPSALQARSLLGTYYTDPVPLPVSSSPRNRLP